MIIGVKLVICKLYVENNWYRKEKDGSAYIDSHLGNENAFYILSIYKEYLIFSYWSIMFKILVKEIDTSKV